MIRNKFLIAAVLLMISIPAFNQNPIIDKRTLETMKKGNYGAVTAINTQLSTPGSDALYLINLPANISKIHWELMIQQVDGIKLLKTENGFIVFETGSGTYSFEAKYAE